MAISAGTVLLVAAGGVLIYAGFTTQNPLSALKEVASGKPTPVRDMSSVDPASFASTGGVSGTAQTGFTDVVPGEGLSALPRAAETYSKDIYSMAYRNKPGYSDCSSFVGKALRLIGIKPPPGSTTGSYIASKDWKRVSSGDVQAGDLAVALNHMVICYGNGHGIGQQRKGRNVQRDSIKNLMYGNTPFVYLRYAGAGSSKPPTSAMA